MLSSKVDVFVELHAAAPAAAGAQLGELERALKLNETMAAVLTHDLRTPLSAIMMCAELVKLRAADDAGAAGRCAHQGRARRAWRA